MEKNDPKIRYNTKLPVFTIKSMSLSPVSNSLGLQRAKHLLSRCLFGARPEDITSIVTLTAEQALELLLQDRAVPDPPLAYVANNPDIAIGTTWVNSPYNAAAAPYQISSLRLWWLGQMINQPVSLLEKMQLFWHNRFVTESSSVSRPRMSYRYYNCLRRNALGNFKTLAQEMTIEPAMLRYLNGDSNVVGAPNENYARELFELFTIGKGALIADGNYTNYTETDIQQAAKVLTGWRLNYTEDVSYFDKNKHDTSVKTFSSAFGNKTIADQGENEYKALIEMIFEQKETARNIVRRLYRWFVYYSIDDSIEEQIIEPLADLLYASNYDIKPVLISLLSSEHFFDEGFMGCLIKSPLEFVVSSARQTSLIFPDGTQVVAQYYMWYYLVYIASLQDMFLSDPPNVAGWPAYYLDPLFNQIWINSSSLSYRSSFIDRITSSTGYSSSGAVLKVDLVGLAEKTSSPSDINVLVSELWDRFCPKPIETDQSVMLKSVIIPGLPDFEWSVEWNKYKSDPQNSNQRNLIETKLRNAIRKMLKLAHFQLY